MFTVVAVVVYWPSQFIAAPNVVVVIGEWRRVAKQGRFGVARAFIVEASIKHQSVHPCRQMFSITSHSSQVFRLFYSQSATIYTPNLPQGEKERDNVWPTCRASAVMPPIVVIEPSRRALVVMPPTIGRKRKNDRTTPNNEPFCKLSPT